MLGSVFGSGGVQRGGLERASKVYGGERIALRSDLRTSAARRTRASKLFLRLFRLFSLDIQRAALYFDEGAADVFTQDSQGHESQAADEQDKAQQ